MSFRVSGLGIGVILLSTIWGIGLFCCLLFSRRQGIQSGLKFVVIALIPTLILWFWPRNQCDTELPEITDVDLPIDYVAIPRILLAIILVILSIICGFHFLRQLFFFESRVRPIHKID
ncbi:hypothetical protein M3Y94_00442000 [Aphelenchoides besseyi]|nr:hypothetical protein M3Y94_00442000 [Aphelenchoides besseyi]KAI6229386.1 hypothetical protein M3Y95_00525700 [Aphelenchoides besseyi]